MGRNISNGQLLDYRSDITALAKRHPSLAQTFNRLCLELDSPLPQVDDPQLSLEARLEAQATAVNIRNRAAKELDSVLAEIRQQPEFQNFLQPPTEESFGEAAQCGPVVILFSTQLRSDAIIVTRDSITSLRLKKLTNQRLVQYLAPRERSTGALGRPNKALRKLLSLLWDAAVQPVLKELGYFGKNGGELHAETLPRIWWIGVGLLAKAPVHAAVKYMDDRVINSTLKYCIPSYTPTLKALTHSRSRNIHAGDGLNMLLITMPTTPDSSDLPEIRTEASNILQSFSQLSKESSVPHMVKKLPRPSAREVLEQIQTYNIVHFACHGVSTRNPANSHLQLVKTEKSPKGFFTEAIDLLYVRDIAALKLPNSAKLAYLSACSSADNPALNLADEVTHIASSFQLAGFSHVIGALWPAEDEACSRMTLKFYSSLLGTNGNRIPAAYREALMNLQTHKPDQPMYWAPFIHMGA